MSGCRLSSAIREGRIAFGNDRAGMATGGGVCGESVMRPRGALCGCCENTLLWDVETVLYGCWSKVGRSRLSSFSEGMPSGVVLWNR
jgi:hypothetical protein